MFIQQHNFGEKLSLRCGHTDGIHNSGEHLHRSCEIEIVVDGEIEITVEGKTTTAKAGDIAIITPFRVHSFYTPRYVKQLICVFPHSFIEGFLPFSELCQKRAEHVFHAPEYLWSYLIGSDFPNTRSKFKFDPIADRDYIHKISSVLHLILAEYFNSTPITSASKIDNTLSKILIYISENYDKDISLDSVGEALGYSPKYVSGCLNAIQGIKFRSLINSLRIEKAKKLLINTNNNNEEIAYECGFISQVSFYRAFVDLVGVTPKKYRIENNRRNQS